MRMMRIRGVRTTNLVAILIGVGLYSSFILIPQFVQEPQITGYGFGASLVVGGLFLLPATLAMLVVGQFATAHARPTFATGTGSTPVTRASITCSSTPRRSGSLRVST
jgi:hypothetical protein